MKMIRNLSIASFALAAALSLIVAASPPVEAASAQYCAPQGSNASGSKRITNPNTNNSYTLNGRGCAVIASADIGYFQSQGYSQVGEYASLVVLGATTSGNVILPAGTYIRDIIMQETSGAAVTGGMRFGTTSGGTDVYTTLALGSLGYAFATDASLAKRVFSATAPQNIYYSPVTVWNGAAVNITVVYGYF